MIKLSLFSARIMTGMVVISLLYYLVMGPVAFNIEPQNSTIVSNKNDSESFLTTNDIDLLDQGEIGENQETESGEIEKLELFSLTASVYTPQGSLHKLYSTHTCSWLNRAVEPDIRPPISTFFS